MSCCGKQRKRFLSKVKTVKEARKPSPTPTALTETPDELLTPVQIRIKNRIIRAENRRIRIAARNLRAQRQNQ